MTDSQKSDETASGPVPETPETLRPAVPSPAALAARHPAPAAPAPGSPAPAAAPKPAVVAPPVRSTSLEEAARFARVEEDGHVFLIVDGEEFPVGQYPDASRDEALAYFVRKYDDVAAQLALLQARVQAKAPTTDMHKTLKHIAEQVAERKMVGDVRALDAQIEALGASIKEAEAAERAEAEAVKERELAAREAIVAEAEEIAAKDPATTQWKTSSNRMNELFEAWKAAQKNGPRLGRGNEDSLWKRFRSARTVFDRHRRAYFSQLDSENTAAKRAKEALIARAEELATSTDWGNTAAEYRQLMDEWKASKRASRKDDDALWARFRAAQDTFFAARQAANEVIDEEFAANLIVKEELLKEAQGILPVRDLTAARKALNSIRDRWEEAGKVPRADMGRMEAGIRKIEEAVKAAEDEHWQKSNPETKARTNSALSQLEATIASLEEDLAAAEKNGNTKKIADAREALEARQQWLAMLQKSAEDFS
ncbi:DUF349 domain-containing protein [Arthrobacter sp. zg-ZUI100]|uniref:DUF349 domain-containing protein n=1 Tax=Arthrobacter jiangjiafuii TaxID=2817475 RepID=A0A975R008_9MICC|nr:DUF349 domain-containing protein [Arthrobacter jiangjiafuii]MBP3036102.1 DUF349 domain-containing protein [Arthrobacter jiangjiafuii]MBP3043397.1 DUF349 domain-containing protein [Arthrobacter jiangjiafuii]QWC08929.1 DUF349 domain-containing protein [Arthrobacter jiangjiafuii]